MFKTAFVPKVHFVDRIVIDTIVIVVYFTVLALSIDRYAISDIDTRDTTSNAN